MRSEHFIPSLNAAAGTSALDSRFLLSITPVHFSGGV
jgi:hypothetical protein